MSLKIRFIGSAIVALIGASASQAAYVATVVGTYDDSFSNDNQVDFSALYASSTGAATSANVLTVSSFTTSVATATPLGFGGVLDFEAGSTANTGEIVANYGLGKSLTATNSTSSIFVRNTVQGERSPISGTGFLNKLQGGTTANDYGFTFAAPADGLPGEAVVSVGLTILSRSTAADINSDFGLVTATATFSDGSTVSSARSITEARTAGDTFFGFVAPEGLAITAVYVDIPKAPTIAVPSTYAALDDLAFTTAVVPEPGAIALLGLGGLFLARRRGR